MALRKRPRAATPTREIKIRLAGDLSLRIEKKAKENGQAMNRVIVDELAAFPALKDLGVLADRIADVDVIVAHYGERITWLELSEQLLAAVDAVIKAQGAAQQAAIDKLRITRGAMKAQKKGGD